jgi:TRAP-type C4-dicarboxylate transport system permease small subunit
MNKKSGEKKRRARELLKIGLAPLIDVTLNAAEALSVGLFVLIVILEISNFVLRYIFGTGIPQVTEATAISIVIITFLGMGRGFFFGDHVNFGAIQRKLPASVRQVVVALAYGLSLFSLGFLTYLGGQTTFKFFHTSFMFFSMPWLPFWVPMGAIPLGAALSVLALARLLALKRN